MKAINLLCPNGVSQRGFQDDHEAMQKSTLKKLAAEKSKRAAQVPCALDPRLFAHLTCFDPRHRLPSLDPCLPAPIACALDPRLPEPLTIACGLLPPPPTHAWPAAQVLALPSRPSTVHTLTCLPSAACLPLPVARVISPAFRSAPCGPHFRSLQRRDVVCCTWRASCQLARQLVAPSAPAGLLHLRKRKVAVNLSVGRSRFSVSLRGGGRFYAHKGRRTQFRGGAQRAQSAPHFTTRTLLTRRRTQSNIRRGASSFNSGTHKCFRKRTTAFSPQASGSFSAQIFWTRTGCHLRLGVQG